MQISTSNQLFLESNDGAIIRKIYNFSENNKTFFF